MWENMYQKGLYEFKAQIFKRSGRYHVRGTGFPFLNDSFKNRTYKTAAAAEKALEKFTVTLSEKTGILFRPILAR